MFITPAYAQTTGAPGGGLLELLFPILIVGLIMWFLVINPQRKQAKARNEMLGGVKRNDTIVTGGGVVGKVTKVVDDTRVEVEIAPGTKVTVMRSMIADVHVKGQPVAANDSTVVAEDSAEEVDETAKKPKGRAPRRK